MDWTAYFEMNATNSTDEFGQTGAWIATSNATNGANVEEEDILDQEGAELPRSRPAHPALQNAQANDTSAFPVFNESDWWAENCIRPSDDGPWSATARGATSSTTPNIPELRIDADVLNENLNISDHVSFPYGVLGSSQSAQLGDFGAANGLAYESSHAILGQRSPESQRNGEHDIGPVPTFQYLTVGRSRATSGSGTSSFASDDSWDDEGGDARTDVTPLTPFTMATNSSGSTNTPTLPPPPAYHIRPDGKFQCAHAKCLRKNKVYTKLAALNHHLRNHGTRRHACPLCGARFHFPKDVRRHLRRVTHALPAFLCRDCGTAFGRPDHLARHRAGANACRRSSNRTGGSRAGPPSPSGASSRSRSRGNSGASSGPQLPIPTYPTPEGLGLGLSVPMPQWNCPAVSRPMPPMVLQGMQGMFPLGGILLPPPPPTEPALPPNFEMDYFRQ